MEPTLVLRATSRALSTTDKCVEAAEAAFRMATRLVAHASRTSVVPLATKRALVTPRSALGTENVRKVVSVCAQSPTRPVSGLGTETARRVPKSTMEQIAFNNVLEVPMAFSALVTVRA